MIIANFDQAHPSMRHLSGAELTAKNLGDAIAEIERIVPCQLVPDPRGQFFIVREEDPSVAAADRAPQREAEVPAVDIRVKRDGRLLEPKHDFSFPLQDGDEVCVLILLA